MITAAGSLREDAEGEDIAPGGEDFASEEQGQWGQHRPAVVWISTTGRPGFGWLPDCCFCGFSTCYTGDLRISCISLNDFYIAQVWVYEGVST